VRALEFSFTPLRRHRFPRISFMADRSTRRRFQSRIDRGSWISDRARYEDDHPMDIIKTTFRLRGVTETQCSSCFLHRRKLLDESRDSSSRRDSREISRPLRKMKTSGCRLSLLASTSVDSVTDRADKESKSGPARRNAPFRVVSSMNAEWHGCRDERSTYDINKRR